MTAKLAVALAAPEKEVTALLSGICQTIAPIWPLDRWIAVNPWWGLRDMPIIGAARKLQRNAGIGMLMPAEFYLSALESGRIRKEDLLEAISERGLEVSGDAVIGALKRSPGDTRQVFSALEHFPVPDSRPSPAAEVGEQIGRVCARFFDQRQSRWRSEDDSGSLFAVWLDQTRIDPWPGKGTELGVTRQALAGLPTDWRQAAERIIEDLPYTEGELEALGHSLLCGLPGWASWCRGVDWRAGLEGRASDVCAELLTILLAWEWLAIDRLPVKRKAAWQRSRGAWTDTASDSSALDLLEMSPWLFQRAFELAWTRSLEDRLIKAASHQEKDKVTPPAIQAAFCIDVRSEVFRRHLEAGRPGIQTIGFAGFFGVPVTHQQPGPREDEPRLPGLLAPSYRFNESTGNLTDDMDLNRRLDQREMTRESVRKGKYSSLSTFTLVETTGLAWAWKLIRDSLNRNSASAAGEEGLREGRLCHMHGGDPVRDEERVAIAENLLRGMSVTSNFGSLLLLVGHGTHTDNNPNEAGLACGACGGKNGGINARIAAELLNDRIVREGLAERGIRIPDYCWALAAEHCTVTDRVRIIGRDRVPDSHLIRLEELERALAEAGHETRRERATSLGLNGTTDEQLEQELSRRTRNWAEIRPEWGLANNAAIIFAKRQRSHGANLGGRCFLHDYDPALDEEGKILEALMTAPMVVANWINLQYFASVTAPTVYGAGNKLLHSVVGGNLGVIEGNGTDLRIGLPIQSVHDGRLWRHEPMRLTVVIDAPEARIRAVLEKHADVAALVNNHWLWLYQLGSGGELIPWKG
ncbi:YbcC family protein [Marinobacter szutsaonensis]